MTWKSILALVLVIAVLMMLGPVGTANLLSGIGNWLVTFFNSL